MQYSKKRIKIHENVQRKVSLFTIRTGNLEETSAQLLCRTQVNSAVRQNKKIIKYYFFTVPIKQLENKIYQQILFKIARENIKYLEIRFYKDIEVPRQ